LIVVIALAILIPTKLFVSRLHRPYFGSENLTLAEPVAGTVVSLLPGVGIYLNDYPKLNAWCDRLMARPACQMTQPTPEMIQAFKPIFQALMAR
jgi:glutathione S-transferase